MSENTRVGPAVTTLRSCNGCVHLKETYDYCEDGNSVDSGYDYTCTHPSNTRFIGFTTKTPDWCPVLVPEVPKV